MSCGRTSFALTSTPTKAFTEAAYSVRLSRWWQAAGFAKHRPSAEHEGKGWTPHVPSAVLETNDPDVYIAFLWGLFGTFIGVPIGLAILTFCAAHPSSRWIADLLGGPDQMKPGKL